MTRLNFVVMITASAFFILTIGCGGGNKAGKKASSLTGWKDNDANGWFFTGKEKKPKGWDGMVYIEGGSYTMGLVKDDVMKDWNATPQRQQVRSFYLAEAETTNKDYKSYLTWLKFVFPPSDPQYRDVYYGALPDSLVWRNMLSRNHIFEESYLRAPQFNEYPVVGVSWLQAQRFCEWLTNRANERELMNTGILSKDYYTNDANNTGSDHFNVDKFKNNDPSLDDVIDQNRLDKESGVKTTNDRIKNVNRTTQGNIIAPFRLPTEVEWEYAALAQPAEREYNEYEGKEIAQYEVREKKGRKKGLFKANFKIGRGDYSGIGGYGNDANAITSRVTAFPPNDFGLYGMAGNVAEWVQDVYRPIIDDDLNDFNYFRGNVYERKIDNGAGAYEMIEDGAIEYDTLQDGRRIYKGLPGEVKTEIMEDARDFGDGDYRSSLLAGGDFDGNDTNEDMYKAPRRRFVVNSETNSVELEKDEATINGQRTSDISNETRVVKGGSWRDGFYWLDPAQRRYLHEAKAASWIGFRVAQDYLGDETSKRTKRGIN